VRVSETGAKHTGERSCGHAAAVTPAGMRDTGIWSPVHFFRSELSSDATEKHVFRDFMTRAVVSVGETGVRHTGEPSCGHGTAVTPAGVRETDAWPAVHFFMVFRWHLVAQAPPKCLIYLVDVGCLHTRARHRLISQESGRNFDIIKKQKFWTIITMKPLAGPAYLSQGIPFGASRVCDHASSTETFAMGTAHCGKAQPLATDLSRPVSFF